MSRTDKEKSVREQSVYVHPTMEGLLLKKGVLRAKKIKCWLQGSMLYEQKDQDVSFHDIRQAQTARTVTNDPSRTQFEIVIRKKTLTYTCSSPRECTEWVSALQKCMMLRGSCDMDSNSMFYMDNHSTYATIDEANSGPASMSSLSSQTDNGNAEADEYHTPHDAVEETVTSHNVYEDVELRKSSYGFGNQDTQTDNSKKEPVSNDYSDGMSAQGEQVYDECSEVVSDNGETMDNAHSDGISSKGEPSDVNADSVSETEYAKVVKKTPDPKNAFAVFETAFEDFELPDDALPNSLVPEDLSCIRTLKTFLRSNKMYCRSSALKNSSNEDCLAALKDCLSTLKIN